jgi:hypothetical protein
LQVQAAPTRSIVTSLREAVRRWFGLRKPEPTGAADYSYVVHWTKTARAWDAAKRETVRLALIDLIGRDDFVATPFERTYAIAELDDSPHAGASLIALLKVLGALSRSMDDSVEEPG